MDERQFEALAGEALRSIERALDQSGVDADIELKEGGVLELEFGNGSKIIVNRHVPNREIWVAARSGGFHFRADGGAWRDARSGGELGGELTRLLREQAGLAVDLSRLPGPAA